MLSSFEPGRPCIFLSPRSGGKRELLPATIVGREILHRNGVRSVTIRLERGSRLVRTVTDRLFESSGEALSALALSSLPGNGPRL